MSQKNINKEKLDFLNFNTFLISLTISKIKDIIHRYNDLFEENGKKDKKIRGFSRSFSPESEKNYGIEE